MTFLFIKTMFIKYLLRRVFIITQFNMLYIQDNKEQFDIGCIRKNRSTNEEMM